MATILVVDENPIERRVVRMTLEGEGHRIAEAPDALQAMELLRSFAFDVVLVAMGVEKVHGYDLITHGRALEGRSETRFVAVLEQADDKGPVESFIAGATDLLIRPFGAPELRDAIDRATAPELIDLRDRLVGIQLDAYETAIRLQEQARR